MPPTTLLADPGLLVLETRTRTHRVERVGTGRAGGMRWILVATVLAIVAAGLGFLGTWPPFATVMSASMAPTINTGDVVVLKQLDTPAAVGQVVMVRVPDEARTRYGYPPVVIHRVVAIAADGAVTTQGDAKDEADPFTVPRSAITTRVLTHIPAAGQVFSFLGSTLGLLWLVSGAALFFAMPLVDRYRDAQRRAGDERDERELVLEELRVQVELLPTQIERAVATAVAAVTPPATRPAAPEEATAAPSRLVAATAAAAPGPAVTPASVVAAAAPGTSTPLADTPVSCATPTPFADTSSVAAAPTPFVAASAPVAAPTPFVAASAPVATPSPFADVPAVRGSSSLFAPPVVAAPAAPRFVAASQLTRLAVAGPVPPAPPVPPSHFPAARRFAAPPAPRVFPARPHTVGALCAVGGP